MADEVRIIVTAKDEATSVLRGIGGNLDTIGKAALGLAGGGLVALVGGLGAVATAGVNASRDLQAQMSDIQAIMGTTSEETETLRDHILELGVDPNLKVSATEAGDAIFELAAQGLTLDEIMGGAARSTVLLSNATGGDMTLSATVATDAMSLWNIEASKMEDAVNGITSVANVSKFGIEDYSGAIAQAGGVAAAVGVEFDDFNAIIAAIAPSFSSGSDAGTSLKTMLQRLVPTTGPAAEAFHELGLMTQETSVAMDWLRRRGIEPLSEDWNTLQTQMMEVHAAESNLELGSKKQLDAFMALSEEIGMTHSAFFDINGEMKSAAEITGILHDAVKDLSEEDRTELLNKAFGTDAIRSVLALSEMTEEEFRAMMDTMGQTSAADAAATRMDNLNGSMEILGGVVETLSIKLGDVLIPFIKEAVDWATPLVEQYGTEAVAAFEGVIGVIETLAPHLETLFNILAGGEINTSATWEMMDAIAQVFGPESTASLADFLIQWNDFRESVASFVAPIAAFVTEFVGLQDVLVAIGLAVAVVLAPIIGSFLSLVGTFALIVAAVALVRNAWENDWGGIRTKTQEVIGFLLAKFQEIADFFGPLLIIFQQFGMGALQEIITFVTGGETQFNNLKLILDTVAAYVRTIFGMIVSWIQEQLPGWIENLKAWGTAAWNWIAETAPIVLEWIGQLIGQLVAWVQAQLPGWIETLRGWATAAWQWIVDAVPPLMEKIGLLVSQLLQFLADNLPNWINNLSEWMKAASQWVADAIPPLIEKLGEFLAEIVEWAIGTVLPELEKQAVAFAETLYKWVTEVLIPEIWPQMMEALVEWQRAMAAIQDAMWQAALDLGQAIIDGAIQNIQNGGGAIAAAIRNIIQSAVSGAAGAVTDFITGAIGGGGGEAHAKGTRSAGSGVALVGERGPELVYFPSPGARVVNAQGTRQILSGAGAGGGNINIVMQINQMSSDIDIERTAYRVAEVIQRKQRGRK